jgi:serine/threonine protein kinase
LTDVLRNKGANIPWDFKLRMATQIASAMEYLHTRPTPLIHRDLKSSNILIEHSWKCKVADFGISRFRAASDQKMTAVIGTPYVLK